MVGLPLAAQVSGNAEWLSVAESRAQANLVSASGLFSTTMSRVGLALVAVQRGDIMAAEEQYNALAPVSGIMVFYIGTDQVLGQLSVTLGRLDQAIAHFEDSLEFCRRSGYRPNLASTCYDYADALLQRNGSGDRFLAITLLEESLTIADELGMRPLMSQIATRRETIGTQPMAPAAYPDGLTQREVEVLGLIALGRNNREIGEELVISLRTVAHHVTSILTKSGCANRTEAAAYAARQGLVSW